MSLPNAMLTRRFFIPALAAATVILGVVGFGQPQSGNTGIGYTVGQPENGQPGVGRSTAQIMAEEAATGPRKYTFIKREFEIPGRDSRPQDPAAGFNPQIAPGTAPKGTTSAA